MAHGTQKNVTLETYKMPYLEEIQINDSGKVLKVLATNDLKC